MDLDKWIAKIRRGVLLTETEVRCLTENLIDALSEESNIVEISSPLFVCGDIHGQFFDLLELFRVGGECPDTNYLFLGDEVDRGKHSVEVISLLSCLKLKYPKRITLIRGNHENRSSSRVYGFYDECKTKYGNLNVWNMFTEMFCFLPLCCVIDQSVFCTHGGLSPSLQTLDSIKRLWRFGHIPVEDPITDLLWSDPACIKGFDWSTRGTAAGYLFGEDVVDLFLHMNDMEMIARAHQLCMDGYQEMFSGKLVTVWSAPNYCYRFGNLASLLRIDGDDKEFIIFKETPEADRKFEI